MTECEEIDSNPDSLVFALLGSPPFSAAWNVEVEEGSCWDGSPDIELAAEANAVELGRTIEGERCYKREELEHSTLSRVS